MCVCAIRSRAQTHYTHTHVFAHTNTHTCTANATVSRSQPFMRPSAPIKCAVQKQQVCVCLSVCVLHFHYAISISVSAYRMPEHIVLLRRRAHLRAPACRCSLTLTSLTSVRSKTQPRRVERAHGGQHAAAVIDRHRDLLIDMPGRERRVNSLLRNIVVCDNTNDAGLGEFQAYAEPTTTTG